MLIYLAIAIGVLLSEAVYPSSYSAEVLKKAPVLGHGFSPYKMKARKPCLTESKHIAGVAHAEVNLDYHLDSTKEKNEILGEVSQGVNLVLAKGKQSLKIRELFTSDSLQTTLLYKAHYRTKSEMVGGDLGKSQLGKDLAATGDEEAIRQNCGEEYIAKIHHGGTLYIAVQMTFLDVKAKQEAEHRIEASFLGLKKVIKKRHYSEQTIQNTLITIKAVQRGGDPSKLDRILAKHDISSCRLDRPDACQKVISELVDYAVNTDSGFPAQLDHSPLSFETASYHTNGFPELAKQPPTPWPTAGRNALDKIADILFRYSALESAAESKQQQKLIKHRNRHQFGSQLVALRRNITAAKNAARSCYQAPRECAGIYEELQDMLRPIDSSILTVVRDTFWLCATEWQPFKADIAELSKHFAAKDCHALADAIDTQSQLEVSGLGLTNLRVLFPHDALQQLNASQNQITGLIAVAMAPKLRVLNLRNNSIGNLAGLTGHGALERLDLAHNTIKRVALINSLPKINHVNVYKNPAQDAATLARDRFTVVYSLAEACTDRLRTYLDLGIVSQQDIENHPDTFPHLADGERLVWKSCDDLAPEL